MKHVLTASVSENGWFSGELLDDNQFKLRGFKDFLWITDVHEFGERKSLRSGKKYSTLHSKKWINLTQTKPINFHANLKMKIVFYPWYFSSPIFKMSWFSSDMSKTSATTGENCWRKFFLEFCMHAFPNKIYYLPKKYINTMLWLFMDSILKVSHQAIFAVCRWVGLNFEEKSTKTLIVN